jgi:hypothetical protein
MMSRLIMCYHHILMNRAGGELDGWIEFDAHWLVTQEWERHTATYYSVPHLARNIGRLAGPLQLHAAILPLADVAALIESTDPPLLADMVVRDEDHEASTARFDTRLEPIRSLLLALRRAQFIIDVMEDGLGDKKRNQAELLRERAALARSMRSANTGRPWSQILADVQEIYPASLGLPPLAESNLRASFSRSASPKVGRKSKSTRG